MAFIKTQVYCIYFIKISPCSLTLWWCVLNYRPSTDQRQKVTVFLLYWDQESILRLEGLEMVLFKFHMWSESYLCLIQSSQGHKDEEVVRNNKESHPDTDKRMWGAKLKRPNTFGKKTKGIALMESWNTHDKQWYFHTQFWIQLTVGKEANSHHLIFSFSYPLKLLLPRYLLHKRSLQLFMMLMIKVIT